jgi:hypothetical protein
LAEIEAAGGRGLTLRGDIFALSETGWGTLMAINLKGV